MSRSFFGLSLNRTFDAEGKVTQSNQPINVTEQQFEEVLKTFIGEIEQTPPPYSAVKVQGRKAYEMARKGEEVELEPRKITVHHLKNNPGTDSSKPRQNRRGIS